VKIIVREMLGAESASAARFHGKIQAGEFRGRLNKQWRGGIRLIVTRSYISIKMEFFNKARKSATSFAKTGTKWSWWAGEC
jgi:hypothetical protein